MMNLLVFISYATADSQRYRIAEIASSLEKYSEIGEVLYWEEDMDDDIYGYMDENLGKCDVFLLFCSAKALESEPVKMEWRAALKMKKKLIPVFEREEDIPPLLQTKLGVCFERNNLSSTVEAIYKLILKKQKSSVSEKDEAKPVPAQVVSKVPVASSKIEVPSGFRYIKDASYSCGGVSHTVREYVHEATGMEFVLVPAGTYWVNGDGKSGNVKLSPYLIGKHEVTQKVWQKIMSNNPSNFKGDSNPVEQVSWDDCQEFCKKTGLYLPTEVQWEVACRAGTETEYYWGDTMDGAYCWYGGNLEGKAHPVGQKEPNAFGLFDMSGNVWEWCSDWYGGNYPSGTDDPKGPSSGSSRVYRGGSWGNSPGRCESGYRGNSSPDYRRNFLGFRCVVLAE